MLGFYEIENDIYSWIKHQEIEKESKKVKYIYSLYYSIVTMITVGYGDIVPKTTLEKLFSILMIICSCGVFAYSINRVGSIIQEMYQRDEGLKF